MNNEFSDQEQDQLFIMAIFPGIFISSEWRKDKRKSNLYLFINVFCYHLQKNISDALLVALTNVQTALLRFKKPNEPPTTIQQGHLSMYVKR